ncbi:YbaK family protein [Peribacillus sp. SCS-155]|uniref:YbaK family protein n=1 Tax=Peribacillus sedimenti TaxID=3115297 RepID=UPI0039059A4E
MNVITTFRERQKAKQIKYDRTVLRELSIQSLKKRVHDYFENDNHHGIHFSQVVEEGCFDVAVEAYLLGANFSKFGYYGEPLEEARKRCHSQEKHLVDTLFNFILYWGKVIDDDVYNEGLYYRCEGYVGDWWKEGFQKGELRRKMRLH